ncbi:excinuclease ABC subunit UvrC [bacterium]|nr:excinuclease ABC subunit UvrC [bacterium]NUN45646.1 excinuclease ABC subunit C [bacterium]
MNDILEHKLEHLPKTPGCYLFKNGEGKIIYIGKAKILRNRVRQYFQEGKRDDTKVAVMVSKVVDLEIIQTDSEIEALILESNLVKEHKPRYNIELKDDKSFPYIKVTDEMFPRIYVTREKERGGGKFFGPYTDVKNLRHTLKTLHRIFPIRSCRHYFTPELVESKKIKLCLDYHIKKCDGPCQGFVTKEDYRAVVDQMTRFLNGKTGELIRQLKVAMQSYADAMKFEEAARLRDRIASIENYTAAQKVMFEDMADRDIAAVAIEADDACGVIFKIRDGKLIGRQHYYFSHVTDKAPEEVLESLLQGYYMQADFVPRHIYLPQALSEENALTTWLTQKSGERVELVVPKIGEKHKLVTMCERNAELLLGELKLQRLKAKEQFVPRVLESLKRDLSLQRIPRRIECFDNSNIQGTDPVASMVVFVDGKPKKGDYRKFKIKTVEGPDDFASMHEIITRRYLRVLEEGLDFPDLIVVDGGKGQLSAAVKALEALGIVVSRAGSEGQAIVGLAKRLEEIFIPDVHDAIMIPKTSSAIKLLQHVRDEAHRFAITFHRSLRDKRTLVSEIDQIEGVGEKRRTLLLQHFGSVQALSEAGLEEIMLVEGIPGDVARQIYAYFESRDDEESH